jgi:hypothetical protein
MVHVSLHSVGTNHKKFGGQNKKNTNVLCRVSAGDTRQSILCREPPGWHSAKKCKLIFAECHLVDTRQRSLCRVSPIWHSTKHILKIKKIFAECQIAGTRQIRKINFAPGFFLLLSLLSLSLSQPCAADAPPRPPAPAEAARTRRTPPARRAATPPSCRPPRATASPSRRLLPAPPSPPPATILRYNFIKLCINVYINVLMFYRLMY